MTPDEFNRFSKSFTDGMTLNTWTAIGKSFDRVMGGHRQTIAKALQLAAELETIHPGAADELRRLHDELEREKASRQAAQAENESLKARLARAGLEQQQAVLTKDALLRQALEALEGLFGVPEQWTGAGAGGVSVWRLGGSEPVRAAIAAIRLHLEGKQ